MGVFFSETDFMINSIFDRYSFDVNLEWYISFIIDLSETMYNKNNI